MTDLEPPGSGIRGMSSARVLRVIALAMLCVVFAIATLNVVFQSLHKELPKPLPPDLSGCTRIEIRYLPHILGYPVWSNATEKSLLTPEEVQNAEMLLQSVVDDAEGLSTFARMIASGSYVGSRPGAFSTKIVATVLCHFNNRAPIRFMVYGDHILVTEDEQQFTYRVPLGTLIKIDSQVRSSKLLPQVQLRIRCARNLSYLYAGLRGFEDHLVYPSASTWGDTIVSRYLDQDDTEKRIRKHFECPAVWKGSCNYAMNPNCKPDSPADTALLFETKPGWNQHGGPELFTFGNHDPPGGLVLLNDGTVKFVRTEEELKQLRWR